jgi:hypothetical protein
MILKRGAWHRFHRLAIMGVSTWGPLSSLEVSDGMRLWCAPPPRRLLRVIPLRGRRAA